MVEAHGFKHLGIRRIPGLRLLRSHGRLQVKTLKQHGGQLLGRIDVELALRQIINLSCQVGNLGGNLSGFFMQGRPIDIDACLLHRGEHLHERKLHRLIERKKLLLFQTLLQHRIELF